MTRHLQTDSRRRTICFRLEGAEVAADEQRPGGSWDIVLTVGETRTLLETVPVEWVAERWARSIALALEARG